MQSTSDRELLERYAAAQDEAAFAELVARYGALVYRACWRVLGNAHDAQDAAQAAFIVLARKAGTLRQEGRVNGWLHRVAHQVALQAQRHRATRERRQEQAARWQESVAAAAPATEMDAVLRRLDAELDGLSAVLREALVLRYLRGFSEQEAAALAGCPLGTMKRRTSDGIAKLRARVARHGLALDGVALVALLQAEAAVAVPEAVCSSIVAAVKSAAGAATATGSASADVLWLAKGALKTLFWAKVKTAAAAVVLTVGVAGGGLAATLALVHRPPAATPAVAVPAVVAPAPAKSGQVWVWGDNRAGQLGDGTSNSSPIPVRVPGLDGVIAVTAGFQHTVALKSDHTVWAWGSNGGGQLGDGTTRDRHTPVPVKTAVGSPLSGIAAIAAGDVYSVALKNDQTVWAWGNNGAGQLGDGTTDNRPCPVRVLGLSGIVAIAAAQGHTVVLKADRTVWTWGRNDMGQLGDGTTAPRLAPGPVKMSDGSPLGGIIAIAVGLEHTVALKRDGSVWVWGDNSGGQLGIENGPRRQTCPGQVKLPDGIPLSGVTAIAAIYRRTLALKRDQTVWVWGRDVAGQLGNGTPRPRPAPVQVKLSDGRPLSEIAAIAAGLEHTLALKRNGSVWAWGGNYSGQLGDGTTGNRLNPVPVVGLSDVTAVAAGYGHTVVLVAEHSTAGAR